MTAPLPGNPVLEAFDKLFTFIVDTMTDVKSRLSAAFVEYEKVISAAPDSSSAGGTVEGGAGAGTTGTPEVPGDSAPPPASPDNDPDGGHTTGVDGSGAAQAAADADNDADDQLAGNTADPAGGEGTAQPPAEADPTLTVDPRAAEPPADPAASQSDPSQTVDPRLLEPTTPPEVA